MKIRWRTWVVAICLLAVFVTGCSQGQQENTAPAAAPAAQEASPESAGTETDKDAPAKPPATIEELAAYEGADREQLILEGAKKEGAVTLYTSMNQEIVQKLLDEFEKKYGIKVTLWRAGSEAVLQRVIQETKAGRYDVDVVETNSIEMEALHRDGVLQPIAKSPTFNDLTPAAILPHNEWVATRLNVFVQAYNTNKVSPDEVPDSFEDLLDPRWKGRLAIEETDYDWFYMLCQMLGEEKTIQLFKDIVATNGIQVRKGHALLAELVASGEIPYALTVHSYKAETDKRAGAPTEWYSMGDAIARPNGIAIPKTTTRPYSALLLYEFMLSEENQKMMAELGFTITNKKADPTLENLKLRLVDASAILDKNAELQKIYEDILFQR